MAISLPDDVERLLAEYRFEVDSDSIYEDLNCTLCGRLLLDAYQTGCGCKYCCGCIVSYMTEGNEYCLGSKEDCRAQVLVLEVNVTRNTVLNDMVPRVRVHCPNHPCGFICQLALMEDHLRVCDQQAMECPYTRIGCCSQSSPRERMETHFQKEEVAHSELLVEVIDNLSNEIGILKEEMASLTEQWSSYKSATKEISMQVETRLSEFVRREMTAQETKFVKMLEDLKSEFMEHFGSLKEEGRRRNLLEHGKEEREPRRRKMLDQMEEEKRLQREKMMREILDQVEEKMRIQKEELTKKFEDQKRELINLLDDQNKETERLKEKVKYLEEASADDEVKSRKIERLEEDLESLKSEIDALKRETVEDRDCNEERLEAVKNRDNYEKRSEEPGELEDGNERRLEALKVETNEIENKDESRNIEQIEEVVGSWKSEIDALRRDALEERDCNEERLETLKREALKNRDYNEYRSDESVESEDGNERRLDGLKVEAKKIEDEDEVKSRKIDRLEEDVGSLKSEIDAFRREAVEDRDCNEERLEAVMTETVKNPDSYKERSEEPVESKDGNGKRLDALKVETKKIGDESEIDALRRETVEDQDCGEERLGAVKNLNNYEERLEEPVESEDGLEGRLEALKVETKKIEDEGTTAGVIFVEDQKKGDDVLARSVDNLNIYKKESAMVGKLSFLVDGFKENMTTNGEPVNSPYFYSHTNGYKLKLRVHPGGDGNGRGTHMSVFLIISKGEYDDELSWPCMHNVTVSIVNHLTREVYKTETISYCSIEHYVFEKPISRDNSPVGWDTFVSHEDLDSIKGLIVSDSILLLATACPPMVFTTSITVNQFSRRKAANEIVSSPYFYSHTGGYKLQLIVHPGGDAGSRGTHMSVYSVVCKGEYDYMLPWPCKINLTVSIVNQLTEQAYETLTNNYCRIVNDFFIKPINKNNTELGWPSFVSHKDLDSIDGLIVNDSIILRVAVAPSVLELGDGLEVEDQ